MSCICNLLSYLYSICKLNVSVKTLDVVYGLFEHIVNIVRVAIVLIECMLLSFSSSSTFQNPRKRKYEDKWRLPAKSHKGNSIQRLMSVFILCWYCWRQAVRCCSEDRSELINYKTRRSELNKDCSYNEKRYLYPSRARESSFLFETLLLTASSVKIKWIHSVYLAYK